MGAQGTPGECLGGDRDLDSALTEVVAIAGTMGGTESQGLSMLLKQLLEAHRNGSMAQLLSSLNRKAEVSL